MSDNRASIARNTNNPDATPTETGKTGEEDTFGIPRPERRNWTKTRWVIHRFKGMRRTERIRIWLHGYLDGKRGMVKVAQDGLVSSPYCTELLQSANKRLDAEWLNCDGDVSELRPFLEQQAHEYDGLLSELGDIEKQREAVARQAAATHHDGDNRVTASAVERRRAGRIAKATAPYNARRASILERLDAIKVETAEALADYEEREQIATSHELVVRHELFERTAIYARGASRHLDVKPAEVRAPEPTTEPRENHYARYRRYRFDAHRIEEAE